MNSSDYIKEAVSKALRGVKESVLSKDDAESVMTSKNENLMLDWKEALPFTERIFPQPRNVDSQLFVFYQNDTTSIKINCEDIVNQNHLSISPPKEFNRVVVIVTKFNVSTRYPNFGASIELYERKLDYDT